MARTTKKMLWRDILHTFKKSRGRFLSIVALISLGSFALVGLKVAGPDMRITAEHYVTGLSSADITIIGSMGIDDDDEEQIAQASGIDTVEFGYLKDVSIKGTDDAVRVYSRPEKISEFELAEGRMPESDDEIALDAETAGEYPIGSIITFSEKAAADGSESMTRHSFTVVGIVNSSEILSNLNRGMTQAASGDLKGYAVVSDDVFDTDYRMVARLSYTDTQGLDPFGDEYLSRVAAHKEELEDLLADRPQHRLEVVRAQYQDAIDEGRAKIDDARQQLDDAKATLDDAAEQIASAKETIADSEGQLADAADQLADGRARLDASWSKLVSAKETLDASRSKIAASETQLKSAESQLAAGWSEYNAKAAELASAREQYAAKQTEYEAAVEAAPAQKQQLQAGIDQCDATLEDLHTKLEAVTAGLEQVNAAIKAAQESPDFDEDNPSEAYRALLAQKSQLEAQEAQIEAGVQSATDKKAELQAALEGIDAQLSEAKQQLDEAAQGIEDFAQQLAAARQTLDARQAEYDQGYASYRAGVTAYNEGLSTYYAGLDSWREAAATLEAKTSEYDSAKEKIASAKAELAEKEAEYEDGLAEYNDALPDAEQEIADGEADLADAKETLAELETPTYSVYNRREIPGAEGYKTYDSVSEIVDSLANIFPYFLYLVAALVASTTMTRMVDEERINAGTLKALGYSDADVEKKFVVYGAAAGVLGCTLGVILGHTLLPYIVYNAYGAKFTMPPLELHFYPLVTLACYALAMLVAVVPAWLAAKGEVSEKPAALLLPKPPASGSKVLLERVGFIWRRLSFTGKVTVRNLFRYKRRAAMTIFGVAGAVAMLFAGFSVQHSISGISQKQFGEIIGYDLIVAEETHVDDAERADIDGLLADDIVSSYTSATYESLTRAAGSKGDEQEITLLVPDDDEAFAQYMDLRERESGESLSLDGDGAIISERLASLCGVSAGDTFTFKDSDGTERTVRVDGICEMYMNHFMFMGKKAYREVFGKDASANAQLVSLKDNSLENTQHVSARFVALDGVKAVVQSTMIINQVDVIVASLNKIMGILILIAALLAIVILFNLVTINVSERIRELSTIKVLGFYPGEVSMYIYRETIILSVIGVPVGWAFGRFLQLYIINAVPPEQVMFSPECGWACFIVPAVVIAAVVTLLYFVVKRRLRKVDMLEALKSVD